jgi:predicted methyltransferase MtxX (methanogen marker protein 4)
VSVQKNWERKTKNKKTETLKLHMSLLSDIEVKARQNHARIGLGIGKISEKIIRSAESATEYADVVLIGNENEVKAIGTDLEIIQSDEAPKKLVELLISGKIDGAVRGTLSATKTLSELKRNFTGSRCWKQRVVNLFSLLLSGLMKEIP